MSKLYDDNPYDGSGDFKFPLIVLGVLAGFAAFVIGVVMLFL